MTPSTDPAEPQVLTATAGPQVLEEVEALLAQTWAENWHVPDGIRMQVGIAVGEIAANIVEHAAAGRPVQIRVEVRVLPTQVWVEFVDDGPPADIDLSAASMPDEMAERGRGLSLAQATLGRLEYRRDVANRWTLVSKPFGAGSGA